MSQTELVTLTEGAEIVVAPLNGNFTYLEDRIDTSDANITSNASNISSLQSSLSTTSSNVSTLQSQMSTAQSNISALQTFQAAPVNTLSGTSITLTDNSYNQLTVSGNTTFTLPTVSDANTHQIEVNLKMGTLYTIDVGTTYYYTNAMPAFTGTGNYELIYTYDHLESKWRCGCVRVEVMS